MPTQTSDRVPLKSRENIPFESSNSASKHSQSDAFLKLSNLLFASPAVPEDEETSTDSEGGPNRDPEDVALSFKRDEEERQETREEKEEVHEFPTTEDAQDD